MTTVRRRIKRLRTIGVTLRAELAISAGGGLSRTCYAAIHQVDRHHHGDQFFRTAADLYGHVDESAFDRSRVEQVLLVATISPCFPTIGTINMNSA